MDDTHDPNKERLELALEAAGLDLWETNLIDGTMTKAVSKTLKELGYDDSEVGFYLADTLNKLSHPDDVPRIYAAIGEHLSGKTSQYRCEFRLRSKNGDWVWFANYGKVMDRDAVNVGRRFIGVTFNINDRKAQEEALREANERAEAASMAKSRFLANMSHEIRTPMNAIIGLSHLALNTGLTAQQRDYVEKIHNAGVSLLGIVNDVLDFSKIEAGKLHLENTAFQLDRVLNNVATVAGHKAAEKGLEMIFDVRPDVPQSLVGDPLRLEQILINLACNAVKFTERGEVTLIVECPERLGTRAKMRFALRDTGIGMTPAQQEVLFQPFSQADDSITRRYGGTGLGLSICKHLVQLMDGDIQVESMADAGSTFHFTAWLELGREPAAPPSPGHLGSMRILVADDNPVARKVLAGYCAGLGTCVEEVADGEQAVAAVRQAALSGTPFDVVLMDWEMPFLNGIDVACVIREDATLERKPAIVLATAFGRDDIRREAAVAGIDFFLVKPVSASILGNTLAMLHEGGGPAPSGSRSESHWHFDGLRVLLVEDNSINRQIATELMSGAGIAVDAAENGRIALQKLQADKYDVVLMDLQMPEMDGYAATAAIRDMPRFANLPILAMTAHAMPEERERCLAVGMNDHITKPIIPDILFASLMRWATAGLAPATDATKRVRNRRTSLPLAPDNEWIQAGSAIDRIGCDRDFYYGLLSEFMATHSHDTEEIHAALAAGDRQRARQAIHALRGVAANLGAFRLAAAAGEVEKAVSLESGLAEAMANLESTLKSTVTAIVGMLLPRTGHDGDAALALAGRTRLIEEFLLQLRRDGSGALEYFYRSRSELLFLLGDRAKALECAMRDFDIETAVKVLEMAMTSPE